MRTVATFKYRKISIATASTIFSAAMLLVSPLAHAANGGAPQPVNGTISLPANSIKLGSCPFDVNLTFSGLSKLLTLPNGMTVSTSPKLNVTATNVSDPTKTVVLNATGAFHQTSSNGVTTTVVTGRNFLTDPEAGIVLAIGTFSFAFNDANILVQPLSGTGKLINVCDLIS